MRKEKFIGVTYRKLRARKMQYGVLKKQQKRQLELLNICVHFRIFKRRKTSGAYVKEQKIPFRMVVFSTLQQIYNLRNLNLKYADFESSCLKLTKKWSVFQKTSCNHARGDMDPNLFGKQDMDHICLRYQATHCGCSGSVLRATGSASI